MATIQIRSKGVITLPVELRRRYQLNEGDVLTLVDLGDGSFVVTPQVSRVARLGDQVSRALVKAEVTTEDLLRTLEEEREQYYRDHYVD